jgi:hypothetical protein
LRYKQLLTSDSEEVMGGLKSMRFGFGASGLAIILRRGKMWVAFVAFATVQWVAVAHSEPTQSALKAWVGLYPYQLVGGHTFFDGPDVLAGVISALGPAAIPQIKTMASVGPVIQRGYWIIAYGCQPHMCADAKW